MKETIRVRDLARAYGNRQVLDGVSFDVFAGEIFGILGANGAGKTTTVEIVQGLRAKDSGEVRVLGRDPAVDSHRLRGLVGAQLQSSALPERIRVGEALRLFARLANDVVDWRRLSEEWDLSRLSGSYFGGLSGGERQRLFIALALMSHPRVVFLDELTQGLDPSARRETWRLVARVREKGASVVLVTHDMEEAARLCDRIAILHDGKFRACGTVPELIASVGGSVYTHFTAPQDATAGLEMIPGVREVTHDGMAAGVVGDSASPVLVAAELARRNVVPVDLAVQRPSLDDVFLALTKETPAGGSLRGEHR